MREGDLFILGCMTHKSFHRIPLALSLIGGLLTLAVFLGFPKSEAETASSDKSIRVLLVDGQNNHDWKRTTEELVKALDRIGGFEITISTSPEKKDWNDWTIEFSKHDVVLNNYFGDPWPDTISKGLLDYLESGGGMVN